MENKPIIILGGGLWGGLLAYRLKQTYPNLEFKIFEQEEKLGGNHTWSFHGSDLSQESLMWLKPFLVKTWKNINLNFSSKSYRFTDEYHSITSERFHDVISLTLKPNQLILNENKSIEEALAESSFVVDARNIFSCEKTAYQKFYGLLVELEKAHDLDAPILMDATVEQKDGYRFIYYLPWDETKILLEDTRYSSNPNVDIQQFREDLFHVADQRGWKIKNIVRDESGSLPIPLTRPHVNKLDRVINLAGIFHDTTGYSLPDAVRLIERMVNAEFLFQNLRDVVEKYNQEKEGNRQGFRLLNRVMFEVCDPEDRYKVFEYFYRLPHPVIQRFYKGDLRIIDWIRFFVGWPPVSPLKVMCHFLPELISKKAVSR